MLYEVITRHSANGTSETAASAPGAALSTSVGEAAGPANANPALSYNFV